MQKMRLRGRGQGSCKTIVEDAPGYRVLSDKTLPKSVEKTAKALDTANEQSQAAQDALSRAESVAGHHSTRARGSEDRRLEIEAATREERAIAGRASSAARRAAEEFLSAIEDAHEEIRAVEARLMLEAHAAKVDALILALEAENNDPGGLSAPPSRMESPWDPASGQFGAVGVADLLADTDRENTPWMVEVAGTDAGLVEVRATSGTFGRFFTTEKRAAMICDTRTRTHDATWTRADETSEEK
ncbi:hypothetical protein GCM10011519_33710 [Marmoricola endophyticus]|uniref:Uncharacterized protein n=1 Tax=Marmoricola endophyticus TaxID=2040280 RepID=A0A917BW77_9ACTN|nr:hypothetical protein [Marmoricola endophyticus]GGF57001.1 hypothetical protein GCM10011519_33710 [Marmoricola endophyticus]